MRRETRFSIREVALIVVYLAVAIAGGLWFGARQARAQAAAPFASTAASVPPSIGVPGVSLAWDTTNKVLVVTFTVDNAAGVPATLTTISYNPRSVEGANPAGAAFSIAGVAVTLKHNLATDPLIYQIGTGTTVLASCTTVTPLPTGQVACPSIPF